MTGSTEDTSLMSPSHNLVSDDPLRLQTHIGKVFFPEKKSIGSNKNFSMSLV